MEKSERFFKNLELALKKSSSFNLNYIPTISFKDYSVERNLQLKEDIDGWFEHIIRSRDNDGIPRSKTVDDCSGMSVSLFLFLKGIGVPCEVIIGDMKVLGEIEYNTSYEYLYEIINGKAHKKIDYHVWIIVENFWIIDPTFRLKESEKEEFITGKSNLGVYISDIERLPDSLEYIPMLVGLDLLTTTNQRKL